MVYFEGLRDRVMLLGVGYLHSFQIKKHMVNLVHPKWHSYVEINDYMLCIVLCKFSGVFKEQLACAPRKRSVQSRG